MNLRCARRSVLTRRADSDMIIGMTTQLISAKRKITG